MKVEKVMSPKAPLFTEYGTMFKIPPPDETDEGPTVVACLSCNTVFPLKDLLDGELEEASCPACKMTADKFWAGKRNRKVPGKS